MFTDDFGVKCSEMRYLPYSADGNILVSKQSYQKEMRYRREEIEKGREFLLPKWESLKIYE
jgi:hypothetical protein